MLVTVPFVLLAGYLAAGANHPRTPADFSSMFGAIYEKLPFLRAIGLLLRDKQLSRKKPAGSNPIASEGISIEQRVANRNSFSYVKICRKIFWPTNLAVLYPYSPNRNPF